MCIYVKPTDNRHIRRVVRKYWIFLHTSIQNALP